MRYALVLVTFFTFNFLSAQNEVDAIRYSQENIGSTARSFAVGGAFGAVGADPSSAAINPAGLAKYRTSKLYLSAAMFNAKNRTTFLGNEFSENKFNFNLPNIGLVVNIPGEDYLKKYATGFVNFVFAFNINRLNNFHKRTILDGTNTSNSITQDWAERGTRGGLRPEEMSPYTLEYLAYNAFLIDPDTSSSVPAYKSAYGNAPINVNQSASNISKGALNDYNFSFAANYRHVLQAGLALGVKSARYIENISFTETDIKASNAKDIKKVTMDQFLKTYGLGFNAKIGLIFSPSEYLRLGFSYHSPTVFNMTDSYQYTLYPRFDFGAVDVTGKTRQNSITSTNATSYKYKITTPARQVVSLALINKEMGFVSLDAEFVNYGTANLFAKDYAFLSENRNISKNYNSVLNLRMGVEMIQDEFRIRAGYARYPSPYKKNLFPDMRSMVNNVYTLGFGIKTDEYSFDVAYVNSGYTDYYTPYTLENNQHPVATNQVRTTNIVFTAGFNID
ncbi:MAG: outer membrane protein transport protein [Bacteroidota bacterium]